MTPNKTKKTGGVRKVEKLDIDLFSKDIVSESIYEKKRLEYISEYEVYESDGGFFSTGRYRKRPDVGEAKWNSFYPHGYTSWAAKQQELNAYGQQNVINKINELVELFNALPKSKREIK